MKIEIPIDVWDPGRGGAEGYLRRLARGLAARGHRVRVLCLRASPDPGPEVEVEVLQVPRWPRWLREASFARAALARRRAGGADVTLAVRHALEADVYQPHGGPFRAAIEASLAGVTPPALRAAKRLFRWARPVTRVLLRLDRTILRSPGLIAVSLSRKVEEDFRRVYPEINLRFVRIYNGVDLEEFHDRDRDERTREVRERFRIPSGSPIALFVAHKFGPKGLGEAVRALRDAAPFHLVVVGGGRPGPFRRLALSIGVADRIHFVGPADHARPFYAAADAFVLPTRYDPCSLSVLEALACGVPAVTTTANGAGELLTSGRDGFVVPSGDPAAVTAALRTIGGDPERFRTAALARAKGLSLDAHIDRMEEVLLRAAEERRIRDRPLINKSQ